MIRINTGSSIPIYEQITAGFKEHILLGRLKPGDIIPSVRRLAADNGISPNTVGKAYLEMERLGLISTRPGKGAYVADNPDLQCVEALNLRAELKDLILKMHRSGLSDAEIFQMLENVFVELKSNEED